MNYPDNPTKIPTIIAARPGGIRKSLRATLESIPWLEIRGIANGGLSAMSLVREYKPLFLIIDSGLLQEEIEMLLQKTKQEQKKIMCLVVAETSRQQQILTNSGADRVILRSEPTERLIESLEELSIL